jgi:hypothetical protein
MMQMTPRYVPLLLMSTALVLAAAPCAAAQPASDSAWKLVVRAKFKSYSGKTITYSSPKGTYSATWIGTRHYRLSGTITGRRFTGEIRTRQRASRTHYKATGSGRLGNREVRIRGGGPNNLRTAKLILT